MHRNWKMFQAIFWKEYRESRPVLISLVLLILSAMIYFESYYPFFISSIHTSRRLNPPSLSLNSFYYYYTAAIAVIALCFFLPLLSRESERGTLSCQALKPLSSDRWGIFQWISAFLLSLIPFLTALLVLKIRFSDNVKVMMERSRGNELANLVSILSDISYWFWLGLGILIAFGVFFYFCSMFGANRIQSFAVSFFGIGVAYIGLIFLDSLFFFLRSTVWLKIKLVCKLLPVPVVALAGIVLFTLALFLLRFRLYKRICHRLKYASVITAGGICFVFLTIFMVTTENMTRMPIDKEKVPSSIIEMILNKGHRGYIGSASGQRYVRGNNVLMLEEKEFDQISPHMEERMRSKLNEIPKEWPYDDRQKKFLKVRWKRVLGLHFQVISYESPPNGSKEFDQLIFDTIDLIPYFQRDAFQFSHASYNLIAGNKKGCLYGKVHYSSDVRNEREPFFIAQYTIGEDVQFVPVQEIRLNFCRSNQSASSTVQASSAGIFTPNDFSRLCEGLTSNSKYVDNQSSEILEKIFSVFLLTQAGMLGSFGDVCTDDRFYWVFTIQEANDPSFPLIMSMDFSDLESLKVNLWQQDKNLESSLTFNSFASINETKIKISNQFCVDDHRLLLPYQSSKDEELILLELQENGITKKPVRIRRSFWKRFNHPAELAVTRNMIFDQERLFTFNMDGLNVYSLERNGFFNPLARWIKDDPQLFLYDVEIDEDCMYLECRNVKQLNTHYLKYQLGRKSNNQHESIEPLWDYEVFPQLRDPRNASHSLLGNINIPESKGDN